MTDSMSDDERLAALIDGRLDERQRAELLEHLALSEEDLEVLAEAGAITRELEEEDRAAAAAGADHGGAEVIPLPPRRRTAAYRTWVPIAAVLAGIAVTGISVRQTMAELARSPVSVVDHLASAKFPDSVNAAPWESVVRGNQRAQQFANGVRIGAGLTDLQMALSRGDSAVHESAAEVALRLNRANADPKVARFYQDVADGRRAAGERDLKRQASTVARMNDSSAVALGAWVRAAHVAAAHHDATFFRETRDRLAALPDAPAGMSAEAAGLLRQVKAELAGGAPADWPRLAGELDALLAAAAT